MNYTNPNQNISIYFKEIHSNGSLTREDEITLFNKIAKGDKSAEIEVFNKMSKLAVAVAKTYTGTPELLEDLIQEANMGILTAIRKYDLTLGYRFSSYARWWMKCYVSKFIGNLGVVSNRRDKLFFIADRIRKEYFQKNHREMTEYELMDALEEHGELVTDTTVLTKIMVSSIDQQMDEDEDSDTFGESKEFTVASSVYNDYEKVIEMESTKEILQRKMMHLDDREKKLLEMRFGLNGNPEMDYDAIAERWNEGKPQKVMGTDGQIKKNKEWLTTERIRQIVVGAIAKMK